jgi:pimeloyl-ACP methyl ester carboxylesterase
MTDPEHVTIDLPHLRFSALGWGPTDGRLMLCLHGYPDTAWTWRKLGPHFAEHGFRVVAPFTRGYAPTELARDGDYSVGALMNDALQLHRHLRGGRDAVLVGHDWGALTANGLAAYSNNPFAKVVSMGVPLVAAFTRSRTRNAELARVLPRQLRLSWYVLLQQLPYLPERHLERIVSRLWQDWTPVGYDSSEDLARLWTSLPDAARRRAAVDYYRAGFRPWARTPHRDLDLLSRVETPRTPMLFLHGQQDGAIDPRLGAIGAQALPPGSQHEIIANAGHFMHLDQPQTIHRLIADHIGR